MLTRRSLIWKVTSAYVIVVGLCTAAGAWYAGDAVLQVYWSHLTKTLEHKLNLLIAQVEPLFQTQQTNQIHPLCQRLANAGLVRITVIDPTGQVLGDSHRQPQKLPNYNHLPEVVTAMAGQVGRASRSDGPGRLQVVYLAKPVSRNDQVLAVVRAGMVMDRADRALASVYWRIALGGILTAALGVALTLVVFARQINQPIRYLQEGARRFAAGDLDHTLYEPPSREFGTLAASLNSMARQLDEKVRALTRQSQEQQAILTSMVEGVLAVDSHERIITFNAAAAQFLNLDPDKSRGRTVQEALRNQDLQRVVAQALAGQDPAEGQVVLCATPQDRCLQAHGAQLRSPQGRATGAVIVLHDVTRLCQLENMRQQFVANVSHELKTPITAIKSAAEALTALSDQPQDAPDRDRFLRIIARQSDRLNAIIDDLLMLARIEQDSQRQQVKLEPGELPLVIQAAVETCQAQADQKSIAIEVQAAQDARASINPHLLEQAIVNLLSNAIRYSPPQSPVTVTIEQSPTEVTLGVHDSGPGIPAQHLPRIFERFYRVEQSRSRSHGGTGLGLAIVKHIALAHHGRVSVDSTPGRGSSFYIHLQPASPAPLPAL